MGPLFQSFIGPQGIDNSSSVVPRDFFQTGNSVGNQSRDSFAVVLGENQVLQSLDEPSSINADVNRTEKNQLLHLVGTPEAEELLFQGLATARPVNDLANRFIPIDLQPQITSLTENREADLIDALVDHTPLNPVAGKIEGLVPNSVGPLGLEGITTGNLRAINLPFSSQQGTGSLPLLTLSFSPDALRSSFLNDSANGKENLTYAISRGIDTVQTRPSIVSDVFQGVGRLAANPSEPLHVVKSFLSPGNVGANLSTGLSPVVPNSFFGQGVAVETSQFGNIELTEARLAQGNVLLSGVSDGATPGRVGVDGKIGQSVETTTLSQQASSGLGASGNETFLGNQAGTGLSHSGDSQLGSQTNANQSVNSVRTSPLFTEQLQAFNSTSPHRLQIDVQLSEANRVQLDVAVQQRQVYASLLMDQTALRNLALQNAPQLEGQLTQAGMELREFDAEVADQSKNATNTFGEKNGDEKTSRQPVTDPNPHEKRESVTKIEQDLGLHLVI